jgi:hypothetical protein
MSHHSPIGRLSVAVSVAKMKQRSVNGPRENATDDVIDEPGSTQVKHIRSWEEGSSFPSAVRKGAVDTFKVRWIQCAPAQH